MKIKEIKRNDFYTDGKVIVFKVKNDFRIITECERNMSMFIDRGNDYACISEFDFPGDFRKVQAGEIFYNGEVKVIDSKNIEITTISARNMIYDKKGYITNGDEVEYTEGKRISNISEYRY